MANQLNNESNLIVWDDFNCEDAILTQGEYNSASQGAGEYNFFDNQTEYFLTLEQMEQIAAEEKLTTDPVVANPVSTVPMDTTNYSSYSASLNDIPMGLFGDLLNNDDCFGATQFTSPMSENLVQTAGSYDNYGTTQYTIPMSENLVQTAGSYDNYGTTQYTIPMSGNLVQSIPDYNSYGTTQYTIPASENLVQTDTTDYSYPSNTFGSNLIDPIFIKSEQEVFEYDFGPLPATETFQGLGQYDQSQDILYQAPQYIQQEYQNQYVDTSLLDISPRAQSYMPAQKYNTFQPAVEVDEDIFGSSPVAAKPTPARHIFNPPRGISPLACAGQIEVVAQHMQPDGTRKGEPYQYTIYKPLRPWGKITYNSRGYLEKNIKFNAKGLTEFIHNHPLGANLVLRIEKHPYEIKVRETGSPQYTCCRAKRCSLSPDNKFMVGDLRVAIEEVAGRLGPNDVENNDPYFAAGYIHLECLDRMIDVVPLIDAGILVPDTREILPHEPKSYAKQGGPGNNRMGLTRKQLIQFGKWQKAHPIGSDRTEGKETLNAIMWVSGQRNGRIRTRFPPGMTIQDAEEFARENRHGNGWGGRRMANGTVKDLERWIAEGKEDEIVAPRNGPTGKRGMRIGVSKKRTQQKRRREEEESDSESEAPKPKKTRHANPATAIEDTIVVRQAHKTRGPVPSKKASPFSSKVTFFNKASVLPKMESDNSLQEISPEQARATSSRSVRIKKEPISWVISDDEESEKENKDPAYRN